MTSKKISEFALETKVRNDDIVLITTGLRTGETPATKTISASLLKMSEGAAAASAYIMSLEPVHYWPLELPWQSSVDEITGTKIVPSDNTALQTVITGPAKGAARNTVNLNGTMFFDTKINIGQLNDLTISFFIRPTAGAKHFMGPNVSPFTTGFTIFNGSSVGQNRCMVRINTAGGFIDVSGPDNSLPLNQASVLTWSFSTASGHILYRNGAVVATSANTTLYGAPIVDLLIAAAIHPPTNFTSGQMQDVAIWDKVLTSQEILNISNLILG